MASDEKIRNLIHLANKALTTCHYGRAEKLYRQLLKEAFELGDMRIIAEVSKAFLLLRHVHSLEVLKILKQIDPIQAQRKELS